MAAALDSDHIRDLFSAFGPVSVRRMFGGAGIYADGVMFALLADGVIYLKAGESNAADFDREKCPAFTYTAKNGKRAVMSYRRMPERLYDDPEELARWARLAMIAARNGQKAVAKRSPGPARTARKRKTVRTR
jgi:DNA transformation protein